MKTTNTIFAFATAVLLVPGCTPEKDTEIVPDVEFQSSVDASYAMQVITDIDMICSYTGENDIETRKDFFYEAPGSVSPNIVSVASSTQSGTRSINISFNGAMCRDGHRRNGTIMLFFNAEDRPNENYYRNYGYKAHVDLISYSVDGWKVDNVRDLAITNLVPMYDYDPRKVNLSWRLNGDFTLKHPTDATKDMRCDFDLVKTLKNTSDSRVILNRNSEINWSLSQSEYTGMMFGTTSGTVPFKYKINDNKPMFRDFSCSPDQVKSLTPDEKPRSPYQEYHPFINGTAEFFTSDKYPRVIYYGAEDGSTASCDNSGVIMIKGISYPVDFQKDYK